MQPIRNNILARYLLFKFGADFSKGERRNNSDFSNVAEEIIHKRSRIETTLLGLVQAVNHVTPDDRLVVVTVALLVNSGHAEFVGNFKGKRIMIQ